jgi:hypothetical protein
MEFTRRIEDINYLRENLDNFSVFSMEGNRLILKAERIVAPFERKTSDVEFSLNSNKSESGKGSGDCVVCIDFLEKDSLRIRFSKGSELLKNDTLMVYEQLKPANVCAFKEEDGKVIATTENLEVAVNLNPYSVSIKNSKTEKTTEIASSGTDGIGGGHGGGDEGIIRTLYEYLNGTYTGKSVPEIEESYRNHLIVFAAEKSRHNGTVESIDEFFAEYGFENK